MRYTPSQARASGPRVAVKERAAARERTARGTGRRLTHHSAADTACTSATAPLPPPGPQLCVVVHSPNPTVARAAELVQYCSAQQGGGACSVMLVQLDGQVLQFSVASVEKLAPLHRSTFLDCQPFTTCLDCQPFCLACWQHIIVVLDACVSVTFSTLTTRGCRCAEAPGDQRASATWWRLARRRRWCS